MKNITKNIACACAAAAALPLLAAPQTAQKPNVLIILGDDIGWGDISLHGGKTPTPRIDAMSKQGVELTNFMVSPLCSPSRSMLLTSRHYLRTNQGPVTDGSLDPSELTIAKTFRAGGYGTAIFGKWHNSYDPQTPEFKKYLASIGKQSREKGISVLDYGFDTSWNYYGGGDDYYTRRTIEGFVSWWHGNEHRPDEQGWTDDLVTDHAIEYMTAARDTGKPFFCYVACHLLHTPYQPKWEDYLQVPDSLIPATGRLTHEEFDRYARKDNTQPKDWPKEHLPSAYAAMIVAHNRNFGRLMDALDNLGLTQNTIVVYFTDNGATANGSNLPFKGYKHTTWEGGVHVPCMIRWPGHIAPAIQWPGLSGALELMPTLAAMTGIEVPAEPEGRIMDGKNIWPALQNPDSVPSPVESYYWTMDNEDALRTSQWKIRRSINNDIELYDIQNDIGETKNIAAAHPDVVKNLVSQMDAWVASTGAQLTHLPTTTKIDDAAPSGQVLEISVTLNNDTNSPKTAKNPKRRENNNNNNNNNNHSLMVPFASWPGYHHDSQDLLVVDVMVPQGAQPKGYRLTPLDFTGGNPIMFTNQTGVDQYNRLAWDGAMPAAGYGVWERRAYGLSRNTPHPFNNIAMLISGPKGKYTIYIDNLFILHADGTRTVLWESGKNTYDAEKWLRAPVGYRPYPQTPQQLTALPAGFSNLTVKVVELKDISQ